MPEIRQDFFYYWLKPVEDAKRTKQKTTCYAGGKKEVKPKHLSVYNRVVQATIIERKGVKWRINIIVYPTQSGCVNTISKYRRKIIYYQYRESLREIITALCKYKGVEIIEGHLMADHVHLLLSIPPKYSVSSFMGYLKGKSALMMFDKHANLKYKFGNRNFWSEGYYVSTVGLNEATIAKYIREQEKHDIAMDKLSVKEYEDPFKGSK